MALGDATLPWLRGGGGGGGGAAEREVRGGGGGAGGGGGWRVEADGEGGGGAWSSVQQSVYRHMKDGQSKVRLDSSKLQPAGHTKSESPTVSSVLSKSPHWMDGSGGIWPCSR